MHVYITKGPQDKGGYFRCNNLGAPQVTTKRHAEKFADKKGAQGAVEMLAKMGWLAEVRN